MTLQFSVYPHPELSLLSQPQDPFVLKRNEAAGRDLSDTPSNFCFCFFEAAEELAYGVGVWLSGETLTWHVLGEGFFFPLLLLY